MFVTDDGFFKYSIRFISFIAGKLQVTKLLSICKQIVITPVRTAILGSVNILVIFP